MHNDTYPTISPLTTNLSGKAVFISGASRGIGWGIALSYARAGASAIAIGARSSLASLETAIRGAASEANRPAPKILTLQFDVTSKASVDDAAAAVEKAFGRLDIVINNAGIMGSFAPIAEGDPDKWWETWNVNLRGPYLVTRAFLPLLLKGGEKTIVTVSSVGAHLTTAGLSAYQTSKLAVLRLAEFVDAEYRDQGVCCYVIHPGNIPGTGILGAAGMEGVPEGLSHVLVETVELAADSLVFLTREKRAWLGGRYLNCTWDMEELMGKEGEIVAGDKLKVRLVV